MADRKTYLVVPNFTFRPYTGSIRLGSIVADPTRPHRILSTVDEHVLAQRYPRIEKVPETANEVTRDASASVSGAVWARFLQVAQTEISGQWSTTRVKKYTMDRMDTEYFVFDPEPGEVEARVAEKAVRKVLRGEGSWARKPVYMVNGVKIAKGLVVNDVTLGSTSGKLEASGGGPTPAGTVEGGAKLEGGRKKNDQDVTHAAVDVVFAYQLLEIKYGMFHRKTLEIDEYRPKAGFQGVEDENVSDESDGEGAQRATFVTNPTIAEVMHQSWDNVDLPN
ncbi:hypothetical protein LTR56_013035 [Elasticomyces elasticus]|nr:hypothetical protein LTR22_021972 [Elasticomyces elasticus]KAK3638563.1 hypothetical protein LTR56_013035 [Elasticomyces elasticus]KAK4928147.1 hypothetical protein LTR49_005085 [Elasticomyces elasticus]KAK5765899.1 hypothetical protein LTS12_003906 [Elasticomyces elasticus]